MHKKKFYGQHFLKDQSAVQAILEAAKPEGENVLEIGPGEGVLTKHLTEWSKSITAIDIDKDAIEATRETVQSPKLRLIEQDILQIQNQDISELFNNEDYILVGNLPYNITSKILKKFIESKNAPKTMVVMVQLEVAQRILAGAGGMNMLALTVQYYTRPTMIKKVPKGSFSPPPKVDSAVIKLDRKTGEEKQLKDKEKFFRFAAVAFANKRKQLKSTLTALPNIRLDALEAALEKIHHKSTARPQELSLQDWRNLYKELHK